MKMKMKVEIKKIIYNNENYYVLDVNIIDSNKNIETQERTIIGEFLYIYEDDIIEVEGYWNVNQKYGMQFIVEKYKKILPEDERGIIKYIRKYGEGVGKITAEKIVNEYGVDSLDKIKKEPEEISKIKGINKKKAKKIQDSIMRNIENEEALTELIILGLNFRQCFSVYNKFQNIEIIKENPYKIMDIKGIGFRKCDEIAFREKFEQDNIQRIKAFILFMIKRNINNGNMFVKKDCILKNFNSLIKKYKYKEYKDINIDEYDILLAIKKIEEEKKIKIENDEDIYIRYYNFLENSIAKEVNRKIKEKDILFDIKKIDEYIEKYMKENPKEQKEGIRKAMTNKISILTGGPGTGKTHIIRNLIECIQGIDNRHKISLCSPTGKAAKKLEEATGFEASTIHKRINLNPEDDSNIEIIEDHFLIIDESSMIDAFLFLKVMENIEDYTHILLVGDYNQIPSVRAGNILEDLIESKKIETTKLKKIFRQKKDSPIITNAKKILNKDNNLKYNETFNFLIKNNNIETKNEILNKVEDLLNNGDNFENIQIITPIKKGEIGKNQINQDIQKRFNKNKKYIKINDRILKEGDKVMQTKNNYDIDIYNGSIGFIDEIINEETIIVSFEGQKKIFHNEDIEELDLAYAITIHKSQGSEFKNIIIPIDKSAQILNDKNLLYTAITRSRENVFLFGQREELENMIDKDIEKRNTNLKTKIKAPK